MAKKRGNNEGSIFRKKNGSWRAQVSLDGQRLSYTAKTKKECQEWIKKTIGQIDDGMTFANTQITLEEYLSGWITSKKSSIRQTTWIHYKMIIDKYIVPQIGHFKIHGLRPHHIQVFYDRMLGENVGAYTVLKIHTVLHGALDRAVRLGSIGNNPVRLAMPPKEPRREMQIFDENQVSQMLVVAFGNYLEPILHLAVSSGMRQMELLGLKWTDLDWVKQSIKVERQLARPVGENINFTQPKTRYGRRTVILGSGTIDTLRKRYEYQNEARQKASEKWKEHNLIFTTRYGTPHHPRNILRDFKILLEKAGLPIIRFHDLRHTAASLMLNYGIPVIVVSRILGHAKPSITLDVYGHLIPSIQIEAAQKIDELITPVELHRVAPRCTRLHPETTPS
jgi:integrase